MAVGIATFELQRIKGFDQWWADHPGGYIIVRIGQRFIGRSAIISRTETELDFTTEHERRDPQREPGRWAHKLRFDEGESVGVTAELWVDRDDQLALRLAGQQVLWRRQVERQPMKRFPWLPPLGRLAFRALQAVAVLLLSCASTPPDLEPAKAEALSATSPPTPAGPNSKVPKDCPLYRWSPNLSPSDKELGPTTFALDYLYGLGVQDSLVSNATLFGPPPKGLTFHQMRRAFHPDLGNDSEGHPDLDSEGHPDLGNNSEEHLLVAMNVSANRVVVLWYAVATGERDARLMIEQLQAGCCPTRERETPGEEACSECWMVDGQCTRFKQVFVCNSEPEHRPTSGACLKGGMLATACAPECCWPRPPPGPEYCIDAGGAGE